MSEKGKTVLILGNGFDLAHDLPTRYSDFLEFCKKVEEIWNYKKWKDNAEQNINDFRENSIKNWKINSMIKEGILAAFIGRKIESNDDGSTKITSDNVGLSEIHDCLHDNVWYDYLLELYKDHCVQGENWIDFESEIRFIIKTIDENKKLSTDTWQDVIKEVLKMSKNQKLEKFNIVLRFAEYAKKKGVSQIHIPTIRDFREKAFEDLERLTRALELYLLTFVEKIPIDKKQPEISDIIPDYVITFNYTHTYERLYNKGMVYHIHGETDENRPSEENNMVLGIDEYWQEDKKDEKTYFTIFKKFAQRIQKHTGNDGYRYLKKIKKIFKRNGKVWGGDVSTSKDHPKGVSCIYVFGHSLDVTDKDILSGFIGSNATAVTIYCRDRGTEGELIANTIKLIGEKQLLEKSNHSPAKLKYIIQKEPVECSTS